MRSHLLIWCVFFLLSSFGRGADAPLPNTKPLTMEGDLSEQMVAGIQQFLLRQIDQSITNRPKFWHRDFSSSQAYDRSVETNRAQLRQRIGAVDPRVAKGELEWIEGTA